MLFFFKFLHLSKFSCHFFWFFGFEDVVELFIFADTEFNEDKEENGYELYKEYRRIFELFTKYYWLLRADEWEIYRLTYPITNNA